VPLCPPQIPHGLTRASAVTNRLSSATDHLNTLLIRLLPQAVAYLPQPNAIICLQSAYRALYIPTRPHLGRGVTISFADAIYYVEQQERSSTPCYHTPREVVAGLKLVALPRSSLSKAKDGDSLISKFPTRSWPNSLYGTGLLEVKRLAQVNTFTSCMRITA
jgi:hypothetical protein